MRVTRLDGRRLRCQTLVLACRVVAGVRSELQSRERKSLVRGEEMQGGTKWLDQIEYRDIIHFWVLTKQGEEGGKMQSPRLNGGLLQSEPRCIPNQGGQQAPRSVYHVHSACLISTLSEDSR